MMLTVWYKLICSHNNSVLNTSTYTREVNFDSWDGGNKIMDDNFKIQDRIIYGSKRVGVKNENRTLTNRDFKIPGTEGNTFYHTILAEISLSNYPENFEKQKRKVGEKMYEMTEHRGNVLEVVTDQKIRNTSETNYEANIVSFQDFSPYGTILDHRSGSSDLYMFSFQGQEADSEIKGEGNSINYKYRMHDPRIGRFFAVDPLAGKYPYYSPYSFSGNRVIDAVELEGMEPMSFRNAPENQAIHYYDEENAGSSPTRNLPGSLMREYNQKMSIKLRNEWNVLRSGELQYAMNYAHVRVNGAYNYVRANILYDFQGATLASGLASGSMTFQLNGKTVFQLPNDRNVYIGRMLVEEYLWDVNSTAWTWTSPGNFTATSGDYVNQPNAGGFNWYAYDFYVSVGEATPMTVRNGGVVVGNFTLYKEYSQINQGGQGYTGVMVPDSGGGFSTVAFTYARSNANVSYTMDAYRDEQVWLGKILSPVLGDTYSFSYGGNDNVQRIYYYDGSNWLEVQDDNTNKTTNGPVQTFGGR